MCKINVILPTATGRRRSLDHPRQRVAWPSCNPFHLPASASSSGASFACGYHARPL